MNRFLLAIVFGFVAAVIGRFFTKTGAGPHDFTGLPGILFGGLFGAALRQRRYTQFGATPLA